MLNYSSGIMPRIGGKIRNGAEVSGDWDGIFGPINAAFDIGCSLLKVAWSAILEGRNGI